MLTNAYDMLELLRDFVGEATAAQWSNLNLLRRLNMAYEDVARLVSKSKGQWLVKSKALTAVNSILTLPDDCAKPLYLEDGNGNPVYWLGSVGQRSVSRAGETYLGNIVYKEAYPLANSLELNSSSDGSTYTLWYQQRIYELHAGAAAAGGAGVLTLAAGLRADKRNDYYNGAYVEITSGTVPGRYLVTDFVGSTRVLTLDTTSSPSTDNYGIIPITPPECNNLIVLGATLLALAKPSSTLDENILKVLLDRERRERKEITEWLESRIIENTGIAIGDY